MAGQQSNNNLTDVLTDVANAIRAKGNTSSSINARYFADAISSLPAKLEPYAFDIATGYCYIESGNYVWKIQDNTQNRSDVYRVKAGKTYFCINLDEFVKFESTLNSTDAAVTRWRVLFTTTDTSQATADIPADSVKYDTATQARIMNMWFLWTATNDGYVTIQKTNKADVSTGDGIGVHLLMLEY